MHRVLSYAKRMITNPTTGKIIEKPIIVGNDTMQMILNNYYNKRYNKNKCKINVKSDVKK